MAEIDAREFRNALGAFATGVTVITARNPEDGYVGVTANSFNSVSLDPPLVLWSLDKRSGSLPAFQRAEYFAVNVLAADQVALSNRFASRLKDKFEGVDYTLGPGDTPLLEGVAARFVCRNRFQYEGGDHIIFVGEVEAFDNFGRRALLYHQGRYAVSGPHPATAAATSTEQETRGGFVDDYLNYLLAKAAQKFEDHFQPVLDAAGVPRYRWRVLATLSDRSDLTVEDIADTVIVPPDELTGVLTEMVSRGLIEERDGRYRLTESGERTAVELLAAAKAHEADALGAFTADEAEALKSALKRLIEWVDRTDTRYHPVPKRKD